MAKKHVLIVGASGTVGSEITKILKSKPINVKEATSRTPINENQVHLNLVTQEGHATAIKGVSRLFLMSPPGFVDRHKLLSPVIQEAIRQNVDHIVLMTALGANANPESPFRRTEVELEKSGLHYNIIRPNWFYQNFNTFWLKSILEKNQIRLPAGEAKVSFIDARDIAAVAAKLLTTDDFKNKDFDLTGAEAVDHSDVAIEISAVAKRQVTYTEISPKEFKSDLTSAKVPADYADFMLMIMGYLREGYNSGVTKNVETILGRAPLKLKDYVRDYAKCFS